MGRINGGGGTTGDRQRHSPPVVSVTVPVDFGQNPSGSFGFSLGA